MTGSSFLSRAWVCSLLAGVGAIAVFATPTDAQLVEDTTPGQSLGTTVQRDVVPGIDVITDGAQRGQNLFHSFREFNVGAGRGVYFAIPDNIVRNVLTRVTGGNRSEILGTLGTFRPSDGTLRVPGVNLFLINPNGIVFGENARLDVGGSFFATTANAVKLGDAGLFSASQPASSNLLTVDPSAFLFNAIANQNLPEIVVRSQSSGLRVPNGDTLLLLGGNIQIEGGLLAAPGGSVEIGAVGGAGTVGVLPEGKLAFPQDVARATVKIGQASRVDVASTVGGSIEILAETIQVSGASNLFVRNEGGVPEQRAGDLILNATGDIDLKEQSRIVSAVNVNSLSQGGNVILSSSKLHVSSDALVAAGTLGEGDAGSVMIAASGAVLFDGGSAAGNASLGSRGKGGNVSISANSLSLVNGARLGSDTFGGDAGNVTVVATGSVSLDRSNVSTSTFSNSKGGDVRITAGSLRVTNGATLSSNANGRGDAGSVVIVASDAVSFDGTTTDGELTGASGITASEGKGGNVSITAKSLNVTNGANLTSVTLGKGDAGNVMIVATDAVSFDGTTVDGRFSGGASSDTAGLGGKGGDVLVTARSLSVTSGARLSSGTGSQGGAGNAGNVIVVASDAVSFNGIGINGLPSTAFGIAGVFGGKGGNVSITTNSLSVANGAVLTSSTLGKGDAGNVLIAANGTVSFDDDSGATSSAEAGSIGKGGEVRITANSLSVSNGSVLSSRTLGTGDAGSVTIRAKGVHLNNGIIETRSLNSSGGDIQISAEQIRLFGNSDIRTFVETGDGRGGDITLTADSIVALSDSDILTFSTGGRGGNITFNTPAFFGQNYRPGSPPPFDGNNRVDINASGIVSGIITIPDTTFIQNSLTQLAQNLIDPNTLLANSCIVRNRDQNGSFFVTGSGGLPVRPGDAPPASFPTGEVRSIPNTQSQRDRPWQLGDTIVEPQGIYRLPNGKLVMSRECQTQ